MVRRPLRPHPYLLPASDTPLLLAVAAVVGVGVVGWLSAQTPVPGRVVIRAVPRAAGWTDGWGTALAQVAALAVPSRMVLVGLWLCLVCTVLGLWRAALLAAAAPLAVRLASELWVAPLVGRQPRLGQDDAFPSGQAAAATALGLVLLVLVLPGRSLGTRLAVPARGLVAAVAVVFPVAVSVAVVGLGYHRVSDVVGGVALGVAVVLLLCLGIDGILGWRAWRARQPRPGRRGQPRVSPVSRRG